MSQPEKDPVCIVETHVVYQAECTCGWACKLQHSYAEAKKLALEHDQKEHDGKAWSDE